MGDDVEGFRRQIANDQQLITLAVELANIQVSSATSGDLKKYCESLRTTQANFEDRLRQVTEKLQVIGETAVTSEAEQELQLIKEESRSTENCLKICAELSNYITGAQENAASVPDPNERNGLPAQIMDEGLHECGQTMSRAAQRLAAHEKELMERLVKRSSSAAIDSKEDLADLTRLHQEWEAIRDSREFCSRAQGYLNANVSVIENCGAGDSFLAMVSTNDRVIHGRKPRRGLEIEARWRPYERRVFPTSCPGHGDGEQHRQWARSSNEPSMANDAAERGIEKRAYGEIQQPLWEGCETRSTASWEQSGKCCSCEPHGR